MPSATGYTSSPPIGSGAVGSTSSNFIYTSVGGAFADSETITITSGDSTDVLTVSGATYTQSTLNSVTVILTAGLTTFSVQVLSTVPGIKTLVSTNNSSWTDPVPVSYVAYPAFVLPISVTAQTQPIQVIDMYMQQGESRPFDYTVVDANNSVVDLTGKTLRLDVYTDNGITQTPVFDYVSPTNIAININSVTVTIESANSSTPGMFYYGLWDDTDTIVLARGKLQINAIVHT
jgi:hypothetical protein